MEHEMQYLVELVRGIALELPSKKAEKLISFLNLLKDGNEKVNLTSITDEREGIVKHLYDALTIYKASVFQTANKILDIGSGAGVPSIPLAIVFPEKEVVSLEATQKKVKFQEEVALSLGLSQFYPLWGRAEDYGQKPEHREKYDLVTARAVSAMNVLAELTLPFIKTDGYAVFYKGGNYEEELNQAIKAIETFGGKYEETIRISLPEEYGERSLVIISKRTATPTRYPRSAGTPQKKPL